MFSALKNQVPQQAKKRFGVYQKACFQGKKEGKYIYTPKSLQGVCGGGPLRAVLMYRFWPAKMLLVDVSGIFFRSGEGEVRVRGARRGRAGWFFFFLKIPKREGGGRGVVAEGSGGCL